MKLLTLLLLLAPIAWCQQLPDAPEIARDQAARLYSEAASWPTAGNTSATPAAAANNVRKPVADRAFWATSAVVFASTVANVELSHRCVEQHRCSLEQLPSKSRAGMYAVALPIDIGTAFLGYKLKQRSRRWWFVPATLLTVAQTYSLTHAARRIGDK